MKLAVIGLNHKTAPVALRERLSFGGEIKDAIDELKKTVATFGKFHGSIIVSTCNRSEVYVGFDDTTEELDESDEFATSTLKIKQWLADFKQIPLDEISSFLYVYEKQRAINHWLRVASGLDSMILGEPQILGQIRQAVSLSKEANGIGGHFDWLTQQIFASARTIRRDTKVGQQAVTLGFAAAKLVTQIFDKPEKTTLLIVAAGEMNRLVAHNVASLGMSRIIIANRSSERAQTLKDELLGMAKNSVRNVVIECVRLDKLADVLPMADVVSSCSGSMNLLITKEMVKNAQKMRRQHPLLLVDLAVPRDIESSVAHLDNVYLYSVDDLQHVIQGNLEERKQAAVEAELLASQFTSHIESQMQLLVAKHMIADYRAITQNHKERLLALAKNKLDKGHDAKTVLEEFAHTLTQTLTHSPSKLITEIAKVSDGATLESAVNTLKTYRNKPYSG